MLARTNVWCAVQSRSAFFIYREITQIILNY